MSVNLISSLVAGQDLLSNHIIVSGIDPQGKNEQI